eukprot:scpid36059/ scgid16908/ Tyrosine-protein kinase Mer; Proto-oncogene c-Mer; Receptor tyrosine kinase MerTK
MTAGPMATRDVAAAILLAVSAMMAGSHAFNFSISDEETSRIRGLNTTLESPDGGKLVINNVVNDLQQRIASHLFQQNSIDGQVQWQYEVGTEENVTLNITWMTLTGDAEVLVAVQPSASQLKPGTEVGYLRVTCNEAGPTLSRVRTTIHYTSVPLNGGATQQGDVMLTFHEDCSGFVPTTLPTTVPPTTSPPDREPNIATTSAAPTVGQPGTDDSSGGDGGLSVGALIGIIIGLGALIVLVVIMAIKLEVYGRKHWRGRRKTAPPKQSMFDDVLVDIDDLVLGRDLGKGAFGVVREGLIGVEKVAVKIMKDPGNSDRVVKFLEEAMYMKKFHHPNVLCLRGVCFQPNEAPMIVVPFMANGDLHTYLNDHNPTVSPTSEPLDYQQLLNFSIQVTNAMEYLASLNFVHRDLAARNCLLSSDLVLKVADFGLARDMQDDMYYRMNSELRMPVKWTALESINHQKFTLESDVWAYGVLLWEIMSTGMLPYPGIANADLVRYLESGHRLSQPARCPDPVYHVMLSCWEEDPKKRPHFSQIKRMLRESNNQLYENIMAMPIYRDVSTLEPSSAAGSAVLITTVTNGGTTSTARYGSPSIHTYSGESIPRPTAERRPATGQSMHAPPNSSCDTPSVHSGQPSSAAAAKALEAESCDNDEDDRYVPPHLSSPVRPRNEFAPPGAAMLCTANTVGSPSAGYEMPIDPRYSRAPSMPAEVTVTDGKGHADPEEAEL